MIAASSALMHFNPRSPHGERRTSGRHPCGHQAISIHAPRTGSDSPPSRECRQSVLDFNPRSPHGERPTERQNQLDALNISIHAPRTGSDADISEMQRGDIISIHAPRTGSDPRAFCAKGRGGAFQSTLPARGATAWTRQSCLPHSFQSTLPARGATTDTVSVLTLVRISIHAPRTGSDGRTPGRRTP